MGILRGPGALRVLTGGGNVLTATSRTNQIVIPARAQAGDLAVLFNVSAGLTTPGDVVPSGWTGTNTATSALTRLRNSRKILTPSDPGATVGGMNDVEDFMVMLVFRGLSPFHIVTASAWNGEATGNNPGSQAVNAAGIAMPLIVFGAACDSSAGGGASFTTASPAFDATVGTSSPANGLIVGYKIYNGSAQNHSIDMGDLGNGNALSSGYLRLQ